MRDLDSAAELVARFLRTNGYTETLAAFLEESGLPIDAGNSHPGALTVEKILEEKQKFDLSVNFEKLGVDDKVKKWAVPAPSVPVKLVSPSAANILCTSLGVMASSDQQEAMPLILASTADRRLNVFRSGSVGFDLLHSYTHLQDSPILSHAIIKKRYLITTSMSGKIVVFDSKKNIVISQRKDHTKYVVQVTSYEDKSGVVWLATAGWDRMVLLYRLRLADTDDFDLGEPVGSIELLTNPEAVLFVRHPDSGALILLLTRRDSSFLFYYAIAEESMDSSKRTPIPLFGQQNLAPHSNAWVAFTPAAIAISPTDPTLLAVATSSVPHMKLLIIRLLFPAGDGSATPSQDDLSPARISPTSLIDRATASTPAAQQGRAALALQDREAAAISIHCNTMAPQTQYSSPALAWRPDGSGIYVNSDDGVVRGIEAITGKVVQSLVGHTVGSKIRCLWCGYADGGAADFKAEEIVVSGGFDQQLIIWTTKQ